MSPSVNKKVPSERPQMITPAQVSALMAKPGFLDRMPEFKAVNLQSAPDPAPNRRPCRGCKKSRTERNNMAQFMTILSRLNNEARGRLLKELGGGPVMFHAYNPSKGKYELVRL